MNGIRPASLSIRTTVCLGRSNRPLRTIACSLYRTAPVTKLVGHGAWRRIHLTSNEIELAERN